MQEVVQGDITEGMDTQMPNMPKAKHTGSGTLCTEVHFKASIQRIVFCLAG